MHYKIAFILSLASVLAYCMDNEDGLFYLQKSNLPRKPCFVAECSWSTSKNYAMECVFEYQQNGVRKNDSRYLRMRTNLDNSLVKECGGQSQLHILKHEPNLGRGHMNDFDMFLLGLSGGKLNVYYAGPIIKSVLNKGHHIPPEIECWTRERNMTKAIKAQLHKICNHPSLADIDQGHCC